ncbi:FeoB-associated Cys-rich membrane protein [Acetobacterium bakii]|nr:FeoB-associated Cys-rich membrane protein [Acetobacterium bakii]
MATLIIGVIVIGAMIAASYKIFKDHKKGGCSGCSGCSDSNKCHK